MPSSVVFARNLGLVGMGTPLAGSVERWTGAPGADDVQRISVDITDTSEGGSSPYAGHALQGAIIVPRCLFFVNETDSAAVIQAAGTITVNPRRGSQDKRPWKTLDLTEIAGQTIEKAHVFEVLLGETLVPFATLDPLRAVLPLKQGETALPRDESGISGVSLARLGRRMRGRWQIVSRLWKENKARANRLTLLGQIDYYGKLSSQLDWQRNPGTRPVRIVYTQAGEPTAALVENDSAIIDSRLYWTTCRNPEEAYYLLAILNSRRLADGSKSADYSKLVWQDSRLA